MTSVTESRDAHWNGGMEGEFDSSCGCIWTSPCGSESRAAVALIVGLGVRRTPFSSATSEQIDANSRS
jgi:hypothetical protein